MMSSCCTLRLKRRKAFSRDSPSCSLTSANETTPPNLSRLDPDSYCKVHCTKSRVICEIIPAFKNRRAPRSNSLDHRSATIGIALLAFSSVSSRSQSRGSSPHFVGLSTNPEKAKCDFAGRRNRSTAKNCARGAGRDRGSSHGSD
jgi:hypothetical protein